MKEERRGEGRSKEERGKGRKKLRNGEKRKQEAVGMIVKRYECVWGEG